MAKKFPKIEELSKEEIESMELQLLGAKIEGSGFQFYKYFYCFCGIISSISAYVSLILIPFTGVTLLHSACLFVISYIIGKSLDKHQDFMPERIRQVMLFRQLELATDLLKEIKDKIDK